MTATDQSTTARRHDHDDDHDTTSMPIPSAKHVQLPARLRKQVRPFATTSTPLLLSGWFPLAIPYGQKWPPPKGLTGKSLEARNITASAVAWVNAAPSIYGTDIEPATDATALPEPSEHYADHNTGVRIPPTVIVFDVDDYPDEGKNGWSSLVAFAQTHSLGDPAETLPPTVRVTPRGFRSKSGHRFFRLTDWQSEAIASGEIHLPSEPAPHVDILHTGHRYSMEGGSVHPDGFVYRVYDERSVKPSIALQDGLATVHPDELPLLPEPWFDALVAVAQNRHAISSAPATSAGDAASTPHESLEAPVTDEERAEAKALLSNWLDDHDSGVLPGEFDNAEVLAELTTKARRAVLALDSPAKNNSNVSAATIHLLAVLIEDAQSIERAIERMVDAGDVSGEVPDRLPLRAALDVASSLYARNGDRHNRPAEFERAVEWSFPLALQSVATDSQAQTLQWAHRSVEDEFWSQTSILRSCREFARSRLVSPDAMLACALVIVASWLPPHLTLPPYVGGEASLNFFVALAASSGGGKSSAMSAATEWLRVEPHEDSDMETDKPLVTTIATGEGLLSAYTTTMPRKGGKTKRPGQLDFYQHRRSIRFEIEEIQSLGAAMSREASTLRGFLKQMWTGSAPSTLAADSTRTRMLEDHSFRTTAIAGVQPGSADVLLSDTEGGFPQRWLWVDTYDEGKLSADELDKVFEEPPEPILWTPPRAAYPLPIPEDDDDGDEEHAKRTAFTRAKRALERHADGPHEILEVTRSYRLKVIEAASGGRPLGDISHTMEERLDRHGVLLEGKLAALLAALHGVVGFDEQFEGMAEWMKARSDEARNNVILERSAEEEQAHARKAVRQGRAAAIAEDAQIITQQDRVSDRVIAHLTESGGESKLSILRRKLNLHRYVIAGEDVVDYLEGIDGVTVTDDGIVVLDLGDDDDGDE